MTVWAQYYGVFIAQLCLMAFNSFWEILKDFKKFYMPVEFSCCPYKGHWYGRGIYEAVKDVPTLSNLGVWEELTSEFRNLLPDNVSGLHSAGTRPSPLLSFLRVWLGQVLYGAFKPTYFFKLIRMSKIIAGWWHNRAVIRSPPQWSSNTSTGGHFRQQLAENDRQMAIYVNGNFY